MDRIGQRQIENAPVDVNVCNTHELAVSKPMPAA
jgi:hypothetical protein